MSINVYRLFPFLILSSVYFVYILTRISCYGGDLCLCWTIYISWFIELFQTISNPQFSLNYLVSLVALIVLRLQFTKLVCNRFAEHDFLRSVKQFFRLISLTLFKTFMNFFWSQLNPMISAVSRSSIQLFQQLSCVILCIFYSVDSIKDSFL